MVSYKYASDEVWGVFEKNRAALVTRMTLLAENPEFGVEIYLTANKTNGKTLPEIVVFIDDHEFCNEIAFNEWDCEKTVERAYDNYLDPVKLMNALSTDYKDDDDELAAIQFDSIEAREEVLSDAAALFLDDVADGSLNSIVDSTEKADEIREDFVNHTCEYLYKKWGLQIYRPMILEDENGEEFFEEYPYDSMICAP